MIDPNNLTTDDARTALLSSLATLEAAAELIVAAHDDRDDDIDREIRANLDLLDFGHVDPDDANAVEEAAHEAREAAFLSVQPTGFYPNYADAWAPSANPTAVRLDVTVGGPSVWVMAEYDDDGDLSRLTGHVAWGFGSTAVSWDAPLDVRSRWEAVDPVEPYREGSYGL